METNQNLIQSELHIDATGYINLKETAMWAKLLAIVGMVFSVLIFIMALFAGAFLSGISDKYGGGASAIGAGFISVIYIIGGAIYFFLSLYLLRFAVKMKAALGSNDQESLNGSLINLKLVYRILGIITIVYLGLMALAMIIALIAAASR